MNIQNNEKNRNCAYCETDIKNNGNAVVCPECGALYHIDCWRENRGCAIENCTQRFEHENIYPQILTDAVNFDVKLEPNTNTESNKDSSVIITSRMKVIRIAILSLLIIAIILLFLLSWMHTSYLNNILACGYSDGTVRLWRISDGSLIRVIDAHENAVHSIALSPDGKQLATGSGDSSVRLWRTSDGTLVNVLSGHSGMVYAVKYSPNGRLLASAGSDGIIRLWKPDGSLVKSMEMGLTITCLAFSPDGRYLASGGDCGLIRLWKLDDESFVDSQRAPRLRVLSIGFSADGKELASGNDANTTAFWKIPEMSLQVEGTRSGIVPSIAYSSDGKYMAEVEGYDTILLREVWEMAIRHTINAEQDEVNAIAFSHNGRLLVSGGEDGTVNIWSISDGSLFDAFGGGSAGVRSIAFR